MDMIKVTGLWKEKDKNGNTYLSGNLNAISRMVIMPNTFKKGEKDPDYFCYVKQNEKQKENKPKDFTPKYETL